MRSSCSRAVRTRNRLSRAFSTAPSVDGTGSLAMVFGGFGFTPRQLARHENLYRERGFAVEPVLSTIPELITPKVAWQRGPALAAKLQEADKPTVVHFVSGSFWTGMFMLAHLEPSFREKRIRAIMFDSCPPKSDVYAFGGWLSWLIQAKTKLPSRLTKPIVSQLFHPVLSTTRPMFGIDAAWRAQNDRWMFGGDGARGEAARGLPRAAGATVPECAKLAEAAARTAAIAALHVPPADADYDDAVVPRSTACLFLRGRNDPVLEPQYVDAYYAFLKARTTASVEWSLFQKAQHAMAVVEAPEEYKTEHVDRLLRKCPEWVA